MGPGGDLARMLGIARSTSGSASESRAPDWLAASAHRTETFEIRLRGSRLSSREQRRRARMPRSLGPCSSATHSRAISSLSWPSTFIGMFCYGTTT